MDRPQVEKLYFCLNDHAQFIYSEQAIVLNPGGKVDFTTYFNQLSVNKWKHYTEVSEVELLIDFDGEGLITFVMNQHESVETIVHQEKISGTDEPVRFIALPHLVDLPNGLVSFKLHSLSGLRLKSASFVTRQKPNQNIHLGIAITAFKRDEYVLPAIRRLTEELLEDAVYADKIQLTVVDNGGTLIDKEIPAGCRVIQNRNLGGSGGFARGLLHYDKEVEGITHCLFMDDDASCNSEAIKRTIAFLSFAKSSRTAIAGAMMLEDNPTVQHENGAIFDQHCIPLKNGLDLSLKKSVTKNDLIEPITYGAWWFFAFPLKHVDYYPFPFFVRGDDVAFSCANSFEIATLNGISSLQDPFASKESPMTVYLDTRQNVIQCLLFQDLQYPAIKILNKFWRSFMKFNCAYHYATAEAVCTALEDTLKPASFWEENIDMQDKRHELARLLEKEKLVPMPPPTSSTGLTHQESIVNKLLRWSTLNGHLIPVFLMKKQANIEKVASPLLKSAFFSKELLVYQYHDSRGFILPHSKICFFTNIFRAVKVSFNTVLLSRKLKSRKNELSRYMDSRFWHNEFFSGAPEDT